MVEAAESSTGEQISPALRFVVLQHTGFGDPHFDLMIETTPGAKLSTWRVISPTWPPADGAAYEPIDDHRREYLIYEGPISGDRGMVTRVSQGKVISIGQQSTHLYVALEDDAETEGNALILRLPRGS
jgi:hypothetical protein